MQHAGVAASGMKAPTGSILSPSNNCSKAVIRLVSNREAENSGARAYGRGSHCFAQTECSGLDIAICARGPAKPPLFAKEKANGLSEFGICGFVEPRKIRFETSVIATNGVQAAESGYSSAIASVGNKSPVAG